MVVKVIGLSPLKGFGINKGSLGDSWCNMQEKSEVSVSHKEAALNLILAWGFLVKGLGWCQMSCTAVQPFGLVAI